MSSHFIGEYRVLIVQGERKEEAIGEVVITGLSVSCRLFRLKECKNFGLREAGLAR